MVFYGMFPRVRAGRTVPNGATIALDAYWVATASDAFGSAGSVEVLR